MPEGTLKGLAGYKSVVTSGITVVRQGRNETRELVPQWHALVYSVNSLCGCECSLGVNQCSFQRFKIEHKLVEKVSFCLQKRK